MYLVDSHCHLDLLDLTLDHGSLDQVLSRAQAHGVQYFLNVCVKLSDFPLLLRTAEAYPFVSASVGSHPNEQHEEVSLDALVKLAENNKVVAIGETGLDYFRSTGDLAWQRDRFRTHIHAAKESQKPLIIHTRDAKQDTIHIMQEEDASQAGGVMHCFTEDWDTAKQALDLNFYISFSGIVTFKNATTIQEVAKRVPMDRILIETDSPYLAPHPQRGKPNEPSYIRYTAEYIASLRNMNIDEFAAQTTQNFFRLFKGAMKPYV
ncbi:MAG: TatD family hydrolase [Gammaproteobacteria bacterium]|nr:TatD family hydrolase [Gammaproteobacteria bacterium]MCW5583086.1 TatD family hydrolase [Gammaproteobacteria bacterium]